MSGDPESSKSVPVQATREFGRMRDKARVDEAFFEPLPKLELALWETGCADETPKSED